MRLGLFGGSFDPIHRGHLEPVEAARKALDLDRVFYLPTAQPPHKAGRRFAGSHARFAMVELALLESDESLASAHELTPGTKAYTVETVEHFRREYPEASLFLILGADSLVHFHTWRNWQQIVKLAELAVLVRPGWNLAELPSDFPEELRTRIAGDRVHFVENAPVAVSSSEIRRLLVQDPESAAHMLPDLVLRYINKYALYRR